jgi:6-pyruvoyltetrahydropterin/6-carboxytetrahydropterin synthase
MADQPVLLTRRVTFSSGHRYWLNSLGEEENQRRFGRWVSPYNHGHNYILDVSIGGPCDQATGMVVNIKSLDDILQELIVGAFDQKSLNDEILEFYNQAPTVENILLVIRDRLAPRGRIVIEDKPFRIVRLRLEEMPGFWAELEGNEMTVSVTRSYEFAASHRLHCEEFSNEENERLFGKCNNPAGHGHNYVLEVTVAGPVNPETGMAVDLLALDATVEELVVSRYDHKHLNEDIPEFKGAVTTSERVTQEIFNRLDGKLPGELKRVRLSETPRSFFEVAR